MTLQQFRDFMRPIDHISMTGIIVIHILAFYALFQTNIVNVFSFIISHVIITGFGVVVGYHRLLSHKQFNCSKQMTRILALLGSLGLQGGPVFWIRTHRTHHRYSDTQNDPHTPKKGFLWSYCGWIFYAKAYTFLSNDSICRDLKSDPFILFLESHYIAINLLFFCTLLFIFGLDIALWSTCVRAVFSWHTLAWVLTSLAHMPVKGSDITQPRNIPFMSLLMYGENNHLNHHLKPQAPSLAFNGVQNDPGYALIHVVKIFDYLFFARFNERIKKC